jgi:uncharacterized membrane protein
MQALLLFLHVAAAIAWMGGMLFMVAVLRPALGALEPPTRLKLVAAVLSRFFVLVGASIVILLVTGGWIMAGADTPPRGWRAMAAIGVLMTLIFGHIAFAPWRRLKQAVAQEDWPAGARAAGQITRLAQLNLVLGAVAIAAVLAWH